MALIDDLDGEEFRAAMFEGLPPEHHKACLEHAITVLTALHPEHARAEMHRLVWSEALDRSAALNPPAA
jgi:hypothetical protein